MKNNKCVILIPIYKEFINFDEYRSIQNTINLYNDKYDIFFMCSYKLNIYNYDKLFNLNYKKYNYDTNLDYSSILLNKKFYKEYLEYDYMLIVQPDAYIFNGNLLEYYISKGYPYIGAIFDISDIFHNENNEEIKKLYDYIENLYINDGNVKNLIKLINNKNFFIGMNGGLSLRKIDLLYHLLKNIEDNEPEDLYISNLLLNNKLLDNMLIKDIINFSIELRFYEIYKKYNIIPFGSHRTCIDLIENIIQ